MGLFSRKKDVGDLKAKRDFQGLADVIKKDEDQRESAADAIVELGDPAAVKPLAAIMWHLRTGDEDREAAERAIRELGPDMTLDPLIEAVREGELGALNPLVEIGEARVLPRIEEVLEDPDTGDLKRQRAFDVAQRVLMELGSPRAMTVFARELHRGGAHARAAVGNAYTSYEGSDPEVIRGVLFAHGDENEGTRKFAGKAMDNLFKRIRKDKVEPGTPMTVIVEVMADRAEPEPVRSAAAHALGEVAPMLEGDVPAAAQKALVDLVGDSGDAEAVRGAAAVVVLELCAKKRIDLGDPRLVDVLVRACGEDARAIQWPAACALGRLGDRRSTPVLCEILTSNDEYYVRRAVAALMTTKDPEAYEAARWLGTQGKIDDADLAVKAGILQGELEKAREKAGITSYDAVDPV